MVITWNENFRKLTTSDQPRTPACNPDRLLWDVETADPSACPGRNGLIIVWMLHRGIWFEDLLQDHSTVTFLELEHSPKCCPTCPGNFARK